MKKINILCLAASMLLVTQYSMAIVTTGQTTNETYLQNQGFSPETARMINMSKQQINGLPPQQQQEQHTWPVRLLKKFQAYIDPVYDNNDFGQHKIKSTPGMNDL